MNPMNLIARSALRHRGALQLLLGWLLLWTTPAWGHEPVESASPRAPPGPARQRALLWRATGLRAQAAGNLEAATQALESAYLAQPDPEGLLLLGHLAVAQGRTMAARDLARRYLAEAAVSASSPLDRRGGSDAIRRQEAIKLLALPAEPSGELTVLGPPGAWIRIDGHLAGRLPLSRPLWVTAGSHLVSAQVGSAPLVAHPQVPAGRTLELNIQGESGLVLQTLVPAVIALTQLRAVPKTATPLFLEAIAAAARHEHLSLIAQDPGRAGAPSPADCSASRDTGYSVECLDALAQSGAADYVVDVQIAGPAPAVDTAAGWTITLRLLAAVTGELAAVQELRCPACSAERAAASLELGLAEALAVAGARPRGNLELRSEPAGAQVFCDGRRVGLTPYVRSAWAGSKQLELRHGGYTPWSDRVLLEDGKTTRLSIELQPEPSGPAPIVRLSPSGAPPLRLSEPGLGSLPIVTAAAQDRGQESRGRRPRWRLITGGLLGLAAGVLIGFGGSAVAVDGRCSPDTPGEALACRSSYSSAPLGITLLAVGGAAAVAGAVLAAWPADRAKRRRPALP